MKYLYFWKCTDLLVICRVSVYLGDTKIMGRLTMKYSTLLCLFTWVLFGSGCAEAERKLPALTVTLEKPSSLRGIDALDANTVWVAGNEGLVARTRDAGLSWTLFEIPGTEKMDFRDIEVLSDATVLVMSAGPGPSSNIYKTTDSGLSWKCVMANELKNGFYDGFAFWNSSEGVLGGDPIDGKLYLLKTTDGGDTWQRINPDLLPPMKDDEAGGFAASGSHIAVYGDSIWVGTGGSTARVFYSKDKGASWQVSETPIIQGKPSQGIFSLDFVDELHGVAVGGDYTEEAAGDVNVIVTEDGGVSWRLAESFPHYQSSVRYVSKNLLISTGPDASYISEDGGYNWLELEGKGYHAVSIGDDKAIWMSGREGRVGRRSIH